MKTPRAFLILVVLTVLGTACPKNPPGGVPTTVDGGSTPTTVNCAKDVGQSAIADAIARVDTVIAQGVNGGSVEGAIIKNLEGLAVDVGPAALACALQYVGIKFSYDAAHISDPATSNIKTTESKVAQDYLTQHQITFAPSP